MKINDLIFVVIMETPENSVQSTGIDRLSIPDKVKNINKIFTIKESGNYAASTSGIIEATCTESALHQHGRHYVGHERDVLRCDPASDGSGNG